MMCAYARSLQEPYFCAHNTPLHIACTYFWFINYSCELYQCECANKIIILGKRYLHAPFVHKRWRLTALRRSEEQTIVSLRCRSCTWETAERPPAFRKGTAPAGDQIIRKGNRLEISERALLRGRTKTRIGISIPLSDLRKWLELPPDFCPHVSENYQGWH